MARLTSEQRRVVDRLAEIPGPRGACTTWVARGGFAAATYSVLRTLTKRGVCIWPQYEKDYVCIVLPAEPPPRAMTSPSALSANGGK